MGKTKKAKSEKASTTAWQAICSYYSTFCGRFGWWWGCKTASRLGLCLRVGYELALKQDSSAVGLHERRLLGSLSVGQGWMKSSPVRHCDAGGEDVWCRFLPNWYQYTYILGRMGARVWYWSALLGVEAWQGRVVSVLVPSFHRSLDWTSAPLTVKERVVVVLLQGKETLVL